MSKMTTALIAVNENGLRIGQDHPRARLTDAEVEALIRDRGPDEAPTRTYRELAALYGISKSSVRDILIGRRRGQWKKLVVKTATVSRGKVKRVRIDLRVDIRTRALIHRLGGGRALEAIAKRLDAEMRRAPNAELGALFKRLLTRLGGVR